MADEDEELAEGELEDEEALDADDSAVADPDEDNEDGEDGDGDEGEGGDADASDVQASSRSGGRGKRSRDKKGRHGGGGSAGGKKNKAVALILNLTLGWIGADRFYLGSLPMGGLKLFLTAVAGAMLFAPPKSVGIGDNVFVGLAIAYIALALMFCLQLYDFFMIGMGRVLSGGHTLDAIDNGAERSTYAYRGRAFLLGFFGGVIGLDRFYMKSKLIGGLKAGLFGVAVIICLLTLPSWQGVRPYHIASKFTATDQRKIPFYDKKENTGITDDSIPQGKDAEVVTAILHQWYIKKDASEAEITAWEKEKQAYFAHLKKVGAVRYVEKDDMARLKEKKAEAGDDDDGDDDDGDDDDDDDATAAATDDSDNHSGRVKKVWFDGQNPQEVLAREIKRAREEMWQETADSRDTLGAGILANFQQFPLRSADGRDGMLLVGLGLIGLSFFVALLDMIAIALGMGRDGKGKPLGLDPLLTPVHCLSCDEQMTIDLNNPKLENLVCIYEECGRYCEAPSAEDRERLTGLRDKALGHTAMALSLFVATIAAIFGALYAVWPDAYVSDSQQMVDAGNTLFYIALALLAGSITNMVLAENSKPLCEF